MESKEMRSLVMAAQAQGIEVRVLRPREVVAFSTTGLRTDGKRMTITTVITIDTPLATAVYRLKRDVGLMWLSPE